MCAMKSKRLLEVCAGNMASVEAAVQAGAERIELCRALDVDGLTPRLDVLRQVKERFPRLTVHVLIRPREGDFVYSASEVSAMVAAIEAALPWADGVVCGALTADGEVDVAAMRLLLAAARGKPFTFHRAYDVCRHPFKALDEIVALGCDRLLTSGQQATAMQGIPLLRQLRQQAGGRLVVMPGGGVNASNAGHIVDATGCHEIHGSCSAGTGITQADEVRRVLDVLARNR